MLGIRLDGRYFRLRFSLCRRADVRVLVLFLVSCLLIAIYEKEIHGVLFPRTNFGMSRTTEIKFQEKSKTTDDVITQRRARVRHICARIGNVSKQTKELSGIKSANLSYCVVPKSGCTMWIRLIKFMAGQNSKTKKPMTLTKYMIHYKENHFYKKFNRDGPDALFLAHSVRVMTVRDPYTRLWSAYIDKFLLPDFWFTKGLQIIKLIRKNPTAESSRCGYDITFPEFIEYVITIGHQFKYVNQDKHWLPASDLCDPCVYDPHIISKQETLMSDLQYTLQKVKLDFLWTKVKVDNPAEYEIKDEIDYNFNILPRSRKCIGVNDLCKRMWEAFKLNGYLPPDEPFPTNIYTDSLNTESFFQIVKDTREKYNITANYTKHRRKHALLTAYKQIPEKHMEELKSLYKMDFDLFDYSSEPNFIHH